MGTQPYALFTYGLLLLSCYKDSVFREAKNLESLTLYKKHWPVGLGDARLMVQRLDPQDVGQRESSG